MIPAELQGPTFILASGSPRRRLLLPIIGNVTQVVNADIDETPVPGETPTSLAGRLARSKAQRASELTARSRSVIVSADTVVALDGSVLGKPRDADHARQMLESLRDREHSVITAVAILDAIYGPRVQSVSTRVLMRAYTDAEIQGYIESGDPFDKAGSYAIQTLAFHPVESIEGCFPNVVGLPLCAVRRMSATVSDSAEGLADVPCELCLLARQALEQEARTGSHGSLRLANTSE